MMVGIWTLIESQQGIQLYIFTKLNIYIFIIFINFILHVIQISTQINFLDTSLLTGGKYSWYIQSVPTYYCTYYCTYIMYT